MDYATYLMEAYQLLVDSYGVFQEFKGIHFIGDLNVRYSYASVIYGVFSSLSDYLLRTCDRTAFVVLWKFTFDMLSRITASFLHVEHGHLPLRR